MDEQPTHEDFSPHIGKRFTFTGHHLMLLLRSVEPQPRFAAPNATREPFTLVFEGPPSDILPRGSYRTAIQDGPAFELYIAPIHTPIPGRQDYQAVFN